MSADLQTVIREALHADEITPADLRHPGLRPRRPRPARQVFAIAGTMAAVVAVAVALAVAVGPRGEDNAAGRTGALTGVVGYRWRVVHLTDPHGSLTVPMSVRAQIGFTRDGYVLGNDTVNVLQARYRITAEGYTVHNTVTSLVGGAGMSPQGKRTVVAVDAMFLTVSGKPRGAPPQVDVTRDGDTLTLHRAAFTLTLHRAGTQAGFFARTPSPTPTKTG